MSEHNQNLPDQKQPDQTDFWQAMGESFGQRISPPVPFEDANPQACLEVIQNTLGKNLTPSDLASLTTSELHVLADEFANFFEVEAPSITQLEEAVADTLARWPVGSLGENSVA
jgi:hypothetical protein